METNKNLSFVYPYPNTKVKIKLNCLYILSQLFTLKVGAKVMSITKFGKNKELNNVYFLGLYTSDKLKVGMRINICLNRKK